MVSGYYDINLFDTFPSVKSLYQFCKTSVQDEIAQRGIMAPA